MPTAIPLQELARRMWGMCLQEASPRDIGQFVLDNSLTLKAAAEAFDADAEPSVLAAEDL